MARMYEGRCKELGIQTLSDRRQDQDLAQVFRFRNEIGGLNADQMFEKIPVREGPVTRLAGSGYNLKVPAARLEIRRNSLAVRTVNKWNELPDLVKNSKSITQFKNRLKTHMENGGRPAR
jgi:hypothetical protein